VTQAVNDCLLAGALGISFVLTADIAARAGNPCRDVLGMTTSVLDDKRLPRRKWFLPGGTGRCGPVKEWSATKGNSIDAEVDESKRPGAIGFGYR